MQHGARGEGILSQTIGSLNQAANGVQSRIQAEQTRTKYRTLNLHHILETVNHSIHRNSISIQQMEILKISFVHIINLIAFAGLAH